MDKLYAHLHLWAGMAHEWSYCDCYMVLADWVQVIKGYDPAVGLRGTYGDPDVCPLARTYRADPVPLGDRFLSGLPVVNKAAFGDVAFVKVRGNQFMCGAIRIKDTPKGKPQWAMKTSGNGLMITHLVSPVKIWGVGYAP